MTHTHVLTATADNNAHGCVVRNNVLISQAAQFIKTGNITDVGVLDLESCTD